MGWYEAAHHAKDVRRYIKNPETGKFDVWQGVVMGDWEKAHSLYKELAKRMRARGLKARVVTLAEGPAFGMSGMAAGCVKRSVIICPELQNDKHILYRVAHRLEGTFW